VMVGDSTFDCEAAKRAGLPTVAVLTGGFSEADLHDAGAECVFPSLSDLLAHLVQLFTRFKVLAVNPAEFACMKAITLFKPG